MNQPILITKQVSVIPLRALLEAQAVAHLLLAVTLTISVCKDFACYEGMNSFYSSLSVLPRICVICEKSWSLMEIDLFPLKTQCVHIQFVTHMKRKGGITV